jgi:hypothetical protein
MVMQIVLMMTVLPVFSPMALFIKTEMIGWMTVMLATVPTLFTIVLKQSVEQIVHTTVRNTNTVPISHLQMAVTSVTARTESLPAQTTYVSPAHTPMARFILMPQIGLMVHVRLALVTMDSIIVVLLHVLVPLMLIVIMDIIVIYLHVKIQPVNVGNALMKMDACLKKFVVVITTPMIMQWKQLQSVLL